MKFQTDQEKFWAGQFGNAYIERNKSEQYLSSNLNLFSRIFSHKDRPNSLIEFGTNVGYNLKAIQQLFPNIDLFGIELNDKAALEVKKLIGEKKVFYGSIFDFEISKQFDVSLINKVLIHINPEMLPLVYEKLYQSSKKYIVICEYYNPTPVTVNYRGHLDRLFKRDFAGEMLDKYPDLKLVHYGFCYNRDKNFPQDDITWFLIEKV